MAQLGLKAALLLGLMWLQGCALLTSADHSRPIGLSAAQVARLLNEQHRDWRGVRYKTGGTGRNGVDCSGFVYRTFKDKLHITLPRSTELQAELGNDIDRDELRAGDLVFFKTGWVFKSQHVGMYIDNNRFLHASTSRGVMISSLAQPYWDDAYWQSRRIIRLRE